MDPLTMMAMLQLGSSALGGLSSIMGGNEESDALKRQA